MLKSICHIGLTVSNLQNSIKFYRDILELNYIGKMTMSGESTETLFNLSNCFARIAYLTCNEQISGPSIELIEFVNPKAQKNKPDLNSISISEICFTVSDINASYEALLKKGVEFLSPPQYFDFTSDGFSKSKAVYFKDHDGIILELMEYVE